MFKKIFKFVKKQKEMSYQPALLSSLKRGTLAYLDEFPNETLTMSFDEYWENERQNAYKSQFFKNKVTAIMPYTTQNHTEILPNLDIILKPCKKSNQTLAQQVMQMHHADISPPLSNHELRNAFLPHTAQGFDRK